GWWWVWSEGGFFLRAEDGILDGDVTGVQTYALPFLTARSPGLDTARANRRCRTDDGKRLDAIEVGFHGRPIERRREMIPDPRRDARTEPSVDDRGSGSVLGFEGDRCAAEPERRVEIGRASCRERVEVGVVSV